MGIWWKELAKDILRKASAVPQIETAARYIMSQRDTPRMPSHEIREIALFQPRTDVSGSLRLNLLIPSINVADSFGGIPTALRIFEQLGDLLRTTSDVRHRIVVTDSRVSDAVVVDRTKWKLASEDADQRYQILEVSDTRAQTIPFSQHDVLVATWWPTAFRARWLRAWQEQSFGLPVAPLIYIVQDFEPAFYPWSSRYAYAESTYQDGADTIAIFNSSLLRAYFERRGYVFQKSYHFEPSLNTVLKTYLKPQSRKEKRILVYGRPSTPRNCFELVCAGLREWVQTSQRVKGWTIVSAGEEHANVPLGNGIEIQSIGKLSVEAYAGMLNESAVGIAMMLSPHPSYPPLEMAHSGILTITNSYAEKDLSSWHDNIYSMVRIAPEELAKGVEMCVTRFEQDPMIGMKGQSRVPFYLREDEYEECLYDVARMISRLPDRS